MRVSASQWPMNVYPVGEDQVDAAIQAVAERAAWTEPITPAVRRELSDWFDHEWSAEAILLALDKKPDGTRQKRRSEKYEDLHAYLRTRLRHWFDDGPEADNFSARRRPPRPVQSLEQWLLVRRRNNRQSGSRVYRPLSRHGQQAREHALHQSRSKTTSADRVARVRASDAKRQAAMDLLMPTTPPADTSHELSDVLAEVGPDTRDKLTANYAGRRALIFHHPMVRRIINRVARERRPLTKVEQVVLRNAIHDAKLTGASAQLEAWNSTSGEIMSPEGLSILAYLDNAYAEDLPFDSLVTIVTTIVENSNHAW